MLLIQIQDYTSEELLKQLKSIYIYIYLCIFFPNVKHRCAVSVNTLCIQPPCTLFHVPCYSVSFMQVTVCDTPSPCVHFPLFISVVWRSASHRCFRKCSWEQYSLNSGISVFLVREGQFCWIYSPWLTFSFLSAFNVWLSLFLLTWSVAARVVKTWYSPFFKVTCYFF